MLNSWSWCAKTIFALPSHCSHWLQPLDRGIFRSFKNAWNQEMKTYIRSFAGRKLEKKDFFLVFSPAFNKAMTVANAQGAFRGSGIFPANVKAIPDNAYDPSTVLLLNAHCSQQLLVLWVRWNQTPLFPVQHFQMRKDTQQLSAMSSHQSMVLRRQPKRTRYQVPARSHSRQPMVCTERLLKLQLNPPVIPSLMLLLLYQQHSPLSQPHLLLLSRLVWLVIFNLYCVNFHSVFFCLEFVWFLCASGSKWCLCCM